MHDAEHSAVDERLCHCAIVQQLAAENVAIVAWIKLKFRCMDRQWLVDHRLRQWPAARLVQLEPAPHQLCPDLPERDALHDLRLRNQMISAIGTSIKTHASKTF